MSLANGNVQWEKITIYSQLAKSKKYFIRVDKVWKYVHMRAKEEASMNAMYAHGLTIIFGSDFCFDSNILLLELLLEQCINLCRIIFFF